MAAKILITRPAGAAETFADQVRARLGCGASIVISPLIEIVYLPHLPPLSDIRVLIFTSVHAVHAFTACTGARDFVCYTVGAATAEAARAAGFHPICGDGDGESLSRRIIEDAPSGPCLYIRGEHTAFNMAETLSSAGIETDQVVLYRQEALPLNAEAHRILDGNDPVIVPLFSPRSATLFFRDATFNAPLLIATMSDNVAGKVPRGQIVRLDSATEPDTAAMLDAVERLYSAANQLEGRDPAQ